MLMKTILAAFVVVLAMSSCSTLRTCPTYSKNNTPVIKVDKVRS